MSNSLPRKKSVVISERSSKPDDLAFVKLPDVYGNKDDYEIFENPMNKIAPTKYLNKQINNTTRSRYYNELPGKLGGKTRRRSKYNKKSRRGGRGGKGGKSKNKKTRKH
jgi:hypothetical protein